MSIFSKPKEKRELTIVFDIGSSSVGGEIFYAEKSGIPKIIYSIREPILLEQEVDFDRLLSSTVKALETVANKIYMMKLGALKKTFCVLSSLWYTSQIRTICLEKNIPFTFTLKLADSLIQKEISIFTEEYSGKNPDTDIRPIELKNIKTMMNGYAVLYPLGQTTKELEMTIFVSMVHGQVLEKFEQTIGRYFNPTNIKFSSFAMASFSVARDIFAHQKNFILVDVGGEVTDISLVKNDALCESISFPMGRNFIIRKVASILKCSMDEARSIVSLHESGNASESVERKIKPIMNKFKIEWVENFQEALNDFTGNVSIYGTILMTAEKDLADFFSEAVRTGKFSDNNSTESKLKVVALNTKTLHGFAVLEKNTVRDSALIIESIYINSFLR